MKKTFHIKRVYEVAKKTDGTRILIDRLWPRGISKQKAKVDLWAKELTPSTELRKWYHEDKESRYSAFAKKYQKELRAQKKEITALLADVRSPVTLVTAVKDVEHSHVPVLLAFVKKL